MLLTTVSLSLLTQLCLIYLPFLHGIFQTTTLAFGDLLLLVFVAALAFGAHEARRRYELVGRGKERDDWEEGVV